MGPLPVDSGPDPLPRRTGPAGAAATSFAFSSSPSFAPPGLLLNHQLSCRHLGDRRGRGRAPLPHPVIKARAAGTRIAATLEAAQASSESTTPAAGEPHTHRAGAVLCLSLAARLGSLLHCALLPRPGRLTGRLPQPALVLGVVATLILRGRQQNDSVPNPARRGRRLAARAGAPGAPRVCGARSRPAAPGAPAAPPPSRLLALVLLTRCSAALPTSLAHSGRLLLSACHANPLQSRCHF